LGQTAACRGLEEPELDAAMRRYARGDDRMFGTLHRLLSPRLVGFIVRLAGSRATAEDLAQETWLHVHRSRSTFADGSAAVPWVYTIARNVYCDHVRSVRLRAGVPLSGDLELVDHSGRDAESEAIVSEAANVVEQVLARIPASQREAFVLLRYEGLSVGDAAAVLGTTENALKLRAFRAYEALRAALDVTPSRRASRVKSVEAPPAVLVRSPSASAARRREDRASG
jgi:RNA polymerase sigma-70 factor (ECF subfamily)